MGMYSVVKTSELSDSIGDGMYDYSVARNDGKKGKSGLACRAIGVSDSVVAVFQNDARGAAFIQDAIVRLRASVISTLYAAGKVISDESIGITALLDAAAAEMTSQRMTKESIESWFDSDLATLLGNAIRAKMVQGIADDKLGKLVEGYRSKFVTLAARGEKDDAGKKIITMEPAVKLSLTKAVALLPDDYDSIIGLKVISALDSAVGITVEDCL